MQRSERLDLLAHGRPGPDEVEALSGDPDPVVAHAAIAHLLRRVSQAEPGWAERIPSDPSGRAPETAALIAELHLLDAPETPLPAVDAVVPRSVMIDWAAALLVRRGIAPRPLEAYEVVGRVDWGVLRSPLPALDAALSVAAGRAVAIIALVQLGRAGTVDAHALVERLLEHLSGGLTAEIAACLAEPWSLGVPVPVAALRGALPGLAAPAVAKALARRGEIEALLEALADDALAPASHTAVLDALGTIDRAIEPHAIVDRALADPPRHARAALAALRRLRRRGHRIEPRHLAPVVELALADPDASPTAVAEVLDPHPEAAAHALVDRADDAPMAARLLEILAELPRAVSDAALCRLAADDGDPCFAPSGPRIAVLLAARQHAPACVDALRALLERRPAWATWVDWPPSDVPGLEPRLASSVVLAEGRPIHWADAVAAADVDQRVIDALGPAHGPRALPSLLRWAHSPQHPLRNAAIVAVGRIGDPSALTGLARGLADPDEEIVELFAEALAELGRRHPGSGRGSPDGPGPAAVVEGIRRAVLHAAEPRIIAGLLARLTRHRHVGVASSIRRFLRHRSSTVRRHAIEAIARAEEPAATAWLLSRGTPDDPRVARALFAALGRRGDRAASPLLVQGLEHPLMNLKKTAAEALALAGAPSAIARVLWWLGRHDNPGLRRALLQALEGLTGDALFGAVRAACDVAEADGDAERVRRLVLVFDRRASAIELARWIDSASWGPRLARLVFAGAISPQSGALPWLRRQLKSPAGALPATPDAAARRATAEAAREALLAWTPGDEPSATLTALGRLEPAPPAPAALVDRACALLPHADRATQRRLLALLRLAQPLDAGRRFLVTHTIRRADPALGGEVGALIRLFGGRPTDAEWAGWLGRAGGSLSAYSASGRVAHVVRDQSELRRALIDNGEGARALREALEGQDRPGAVVADLVARRGGQAALDAVIAHLDPSRWAQVLAALDGHPALVGALLDHAAPPVGPAMIRARAAHPTAAGMRWLASLGPARRAATCALARRGDGAAIARCLARGWLDSASPRAAWLAGLRAAPLDDGQLVDIARAASVELTGALIERLVERFDVGGDPQIAVSIRRFAFDRVWPFVVDRFDARWLAALAPTRTPPRAVIEAFAAGSTADRPALARWFAAAAADGPLHAPGLREALLARADVLTMTEWRLLCALIDGPAARGALVDALKRDVSPSMAAELLLEALEDQPPSVQIPLLSPWAQTPAVQARLAAIWAQPDGAGRQLLPEALRPAVVQLVVDGLASRDAEAVRRALSALVEATPPGVDVIGCLATALEHPASRVQAHAHRLLRRSAPRPRYLAETRRLMSDRHPSVMRRAVRVACYGGDLDAVPSIVPHLRSVDGGLREAAREGLLYLGEAALGRLVRASRSARPDRRALIDAVIAEIEAGADAPDDTADDDVDA